MEQLTAILTASCILFGFFLLGFWFALDREMRSDARSRRFKYGYILLLLATSLLAIFGIVVPLRQLAFENPTQTLVYKGVLISLIGILGYVLTELAHYDIFRRSEFTPRIELVFFWLSLAVMLIVSVLLLA